MLIVFSRNGLHFISDEAYALSVYEQQTPLQTPFQSVLNLWPVPDPQKTHVIWSFSKVSDQLTSLYTLVPEFSFKVVTVGDCL
jgi:aspartate/methionine/tyrosine aminotransferase